MKRKFWLLQEEDKGDGAGGAAAGAGGGAADAVAGAGAGDKGAAGDAGGKGAAEKGGAADNGAAGGADDKGGGDPWLGLREKIANGDDKIVKKLSRYATPVEAVNALLGLQHKISAGEMRSALPKDASPEQIKAWRSENGIPEAPDKYELQLKKGYEITADDKPMVDDLLKHLHSVNAPAAVANTAVNWYYDQVRKAEEAAVADDAAFKIKAEDALRAEFGNEYRLNMNLKEAVLAQMPAELRPLFDGGRLASGDRIADHPAMVKWLVGLAREINPVTTVIPNAGANIASAIDDEIKGIETLMRTDRKAYNADEAKQARYRELLDAKERLGKK